MLLKDIHVGRTYEAKVNGRTTKVRVDAHREVSYRDRPSHRFDVTNLTTVFIYQGNSTQSPWYLEMVRRGAAIE